MATCRRLGVALLLIFAAAAGADVTHQRSASSIDASSAAVTATLGEDYTQAKKNVHQAERNLAEAPAPSDALPKLPPNDVRAKGPFRYHKELFPLDSVDLVTCVLSALGLLVAAGGGIGGGGILVPLFMIILGFRPKHAIALSNLTIFGGSIANVAFNLQKTRPNGKSMIDWDIIVIMEPSTIVGAVIGSFMSKYLPDFVLTCALCFVLSLLSWRTLAKGISMYRKEDDEQAKAVPPTGSEVELTRLVPQQDEECRQAPVESAGVQIPWDKVSVLILCFVGCIVLTILKGSGHGSIIGVQCGSRLFWILSVSVIPWVIGFGHIFRLWLLKEFNEKESAGHRFEDDEIQWNSTRTIVYPLICTLAGLFAGLFGVGGGIVKGPLMLEMGVNPSVAAATAATMIFFTTSAACVSFVIFGLLEAEYGFFFFCMGLICTAVGQAGINVWMKRAKRQSPPVLSIGAVMALSTLLVGIEAYIKFQHETTAELFAASSICAVDH